MTQDIGDVGGRDSGIERYESRAGERVPRCARPASCEFPARTATRSLGDAERLQRAGEFEGVVEELAIGELEAAVDDPDAIGKDLRRAMKKRRRRQRFEIEAGLHRVGRADCLLRQIENQEFGLVDLGGYRQARFIRRGRAVTRGQIVAAQRHGPSDDLYPAFAPGRQRVHHLFTGIQECGEQFDVLMNDHRTVASVR